MDPTRPEVPKAAKKRLTMRDAGSRVILGQLDRLAAHEAGVIDGRDPEEVHHMRVATRRLRGALRLFRSGFNKSELRPRRDRLRRLADLLGAVRDEDVFLAWIEATSPAAEPDERAAMEGLRAASARQREAAHGALAAELRSESHRSFMDDARAFFSAAATDDSIGNARLAEEDLPGWIKRHEKRMRRALADLGPDAAPNDLHALRIKIKRLRYAAEFLRDLAPRRRKKLSPLIHELQAFQETLGLLHDADVHAARVEAALNAASDSKKAGLRAILTRIHITTAVLRGKFDSQRKLE